MDSKVADESYNSLLLNSLLTFNKIANMIKRYRLIDAKDNQDVGGIKLIYKVTRAEKSLLKSLKNKSEEVVFLKPRREIWGGKKQPHCWLIGNINYISFKDVYMFFRYKVINQNDPLFKHVNNQEKEFIIDDSTPTTSITRKRLSLKQKCLYYCLVASDKIITTFINQK